ncbi:MAG: glycosyltransferase family 2 protein [Proteobacteria bacterium]|nr:glycosyltransferase family 2 protein [Pseudomonadota bacterium]
MNDTSATTVVVVTYNSISTIDNALRSLEQDRRERGLRCVVVDNRSGDGALDLVRAHYPWVKAIDSGGNLGFGRGCNLGARGATTPYLLFLNPDAALHSGALRILERFMKEHPKAGICGPAIRNGETLQHAGMLEPLASVLLHTGLGRGRAMRTILPGAEPFRTNWVSGAALMVRTELFRDLGGFDPRFFLYFEESDLCASAREAGAEIWAVGEAVAEHCAGSSARATGAPLAAGCIAEHYFSSRYYYMRKHHGIVRAVAVESAEPVLLLARDLLDLARRRPLEKARVVERLKAPLFRLPAKVA